jgi:uncharacterized protein YbaA (DUF1428 family)
MRDKKLMADARMKGDEYKTVFDGRRTVFGGFKSFWNSEPPLRCR